MDVEVMRGELLHEYPGELWRKRVMAMPDPQVFAIYKDIQKRKEQRKKANPPYAEQLSFLSKNRPLYK